MASILLVDDEKDAAEALKMFFDLQGMPCWVATDGDQTVKIAMEQKPDVVLLDVRLDRSHLSGLQVLQEIKQRLPSTKVVMVSGYHDDTSHTEAAKSGADGYLEKPLTAEKVLEVFKKLTA